MHHLAWLTLSLLGLLGLSLARRLCLPLLCLIADPSRIRDCESVFSRISPHAWGNFLAAVGDRSPVEDHWFIARHSQNVPPRIFPSCLESAILQMPVKWLTFLCFTPLPPR
ncbi:hypothetical protein C8R45DRAFT_195171 [Mycena sanguinolenta]|nr:hypothetical protein C8R45DRAFT_195171 [Mycena sanguinolenta]